MKLLLINFLLIFSLNVFSQPMGDGPRRGADDNNSTPSVSISGYIGNLKTLSGASNAQISIQTATKDALVKEFRFRPQIDVNKNTGNLRAEFSIPLPANLSPLSSLKFSYNSRNTRNTGLGVGWSLNLPYITVDKASSELRYNGQKLVEVKSPFIVNRLSKALKYYNINSTEIKYFRKEVESNFTLILEIKADQLYYLEFSLDGKDNLFNSQGQLVSSKDSFSNEIKFNWENGVVKDIKTSSFKTKFNYLNNTSEEIYIGNTFYDLPEKLNSIDFTVNSELRKVLFSYKDELLKEVKWKEGIRTIFKGEYKNQKSQRKIISGSNLAKDKVAVADINGQNSIQASKSGDNNFIYIDLNGDNHQDRITIDGGYISRTLNGYVKKLKKKNWTFSKYKSTVRHFLGQRPTITYTKVEMAIIKDGVKHYVEDKSLNPSHALGLHPYSISLSEDDGNVDVTSSIKNGTYFVDLNSDGKKDFVYCGGTVNKDKDLISHYDALMRLHGKLSGNLNNSFWTLSGKTAQVYIQDYDQTKIQRAYHHGGITRPENFVPNASMWKKVDHLIFKCSEKSIWNDFNQDGYIDVLTGQTIYYLSPNQVIRKNLKKSDLLSLISITKDLPVQNKLENWSLIPVSNSKNLKLSKLSQTIINPTSLELTEITEDGEYKKQRSTKYPLLSKMVGDFGGVYSIKYQDLNGNWIVSSKKIDPDDKKQPIETIHYDYIDSLIDPFKGVVNGYSKVKSSFDYGTPLKMNNAIVESFSIDSPETILFLEARARLNGKTVKVDYLDQNEFAYKTIYNNWKVYDFEKVIYPTIELKETLYRVASMPTGFVKRDYVKKTFSDFSGIVPLVTKTVTKEIAGLEDIYDADNLYSKEKLEFKKLSLENYRLMITEEVVSNDESSFAKKFEYNTHLLPQKISHNDEFVKLTYDQLGRLIGIDDHNSNFNEFSYKVGTQLPSRVADTEVEKNFHYDSFLSTPTTIEINNAIIMNEYSYDGVLLNTARKACSNCNTTIVYNKNINFANRSVDITQYGRKHSYFFDGLGRIVQEYLPFNTPVFSGTSVFDSSDSELQLTFPNSEEILKTKSLNGQGKLVSSQFYSNMITKSYNRYCEKTFLNNIFQSDVCSTNDGNVIALKEKKGKYLYTYDVLDKLVSVVQGQRELLYERDEFSGVLASYFSNESTEFMSFNFEYDRKNRITTIEGAKKFKYSPAGKLQSIETARGTNIKLIYSKGRVESKAIVDEKHNTLNEYAYDNFGNLTQFISNNFQVDHKYNNFDQLITTETKDKNSLVELNYEYDYTRVSKIKPYIKNIIYDEFGRLTQVDYTNTPSLKVSYIEEKVGAFFLGNEEIKLSYDLENKIDSIVRNSNKIDIDYKSGQLTSNPRVKWSQFDDWGRVKKIPGHEFEWDLTELIKVNNIKMIYEDQTLAMVCDEVCFKVHTDSLLTYKENTIQRIVISQKTVGVIVNGKFYATLSDHLGSIIAVFDGDKKVVSRSYDLWGNKEVQVQSGYEEIEKLIAWSFAGLIEPPQLSGKGLYWSKSRVYSAKFKHWLSIDPAVMYSPEKLIHSTQDWNGVLYCNGDPVNKIDPSGYLAVPVAIGAGIGATTAGLAAYHSGARGWDLARAIIIGAGSGALAGTGLGGVVGSMFIGGSANMTSQLASGKSLNNIDLVSLGVSTAAGGLGASLGSIASKVLQLPSSVMGNSISNIMKHNSFSNAVISTGISGIVGGMSDYAGQSAYDSFNFSSNFDTGASTGDYWSGPNPYSN